MWTWECQSSLPGDPHAPAVPGHHATLSDIQLCKTLEPPDPPGSTYNLFVTVTWEGPKSQPLKTGLGCIFITNFPGKMLYGEPGWLVTGRGEVAHQEQLKLSLLLLRGRAPSLCPQDHGKGQAE